MVNSTKKGKCFERDVAKYLGTITQSRFMRIPQSGGTATTWNLSNLCGDVIPIGVLNGTEKQTFIVECKSYNKSIELQDFFTEKAMIYKFIKQAEKEAAQIGSNEWYLFIKLTRKGVFLIFPIDNIGSFIKDTEEKIMTLTLPNGKSIGIEMVKI